MDDNNQVAESLAQIQARNRRVEADKAWETSWTRRLCIAVLTYVVAVVWLRLIGDTRAWFDALVPVVGFVLSTLSLRVVKRGWVERWLRGERF